MPFERQKRQSSVNSVLCLLFSKKCTFHFENVYFSFWGLYVFFDFYDFSFLFLAQIYGVIASFASGVDAGDEQGIVSVAAVAYFGQRILYVFDILYRLIVDAYYHEILLDAGLLELAVFADACD